MLFVHFRHLVAKRFSLSQKAEGSIPRRSAFHFQRETLVLRCSEKDFLDVNIEDYFDQNEGE